MTVQYLVQVLGCRICSSISVYAGCMTSTQPHTREVPRAWQSMDYTRVSDRLDSWVQYFHCHEKLWGVLRCDNELKTASTKPLLMIHLDG